MSERVDGLFKQKSELKRLAKELALKMDEVDGSGTAVFHKAAHDLDQTLGLETFAETSEWVPGDVALITLKGGGPFLAMRVQQGHRGYWRLQNDSREDDSDVVQAVCALSAVEAREWWPAS